MEARKKRNIKPGLNYDPLFPTANHNDQTIRHNANLDHTVAFIPKVVAQTLFQTSSIAQKLKAGNTYQICKNIWQFVYDHINYKKDQEGFEQIRSPARTWQDRSQGVDCDCYSVFISSILTNLHIPHVLRITKYHRNYFQHIYPVVQAPSLVTSPGNNPEIILDCVTDHFNYEVPYSAKKDYPMDLQYLDGLDGDTLGLFGKKKKKAQQPSSATTIKTASSPIPATTNTTVPAKKKGIFKKVLNVVNKINPATLLLRNGVLAAMKLNIKNVAKRLRWSYLSPDKIAKHGIDPAKFQQLVATRQKLENIFYGAGGKPDNLRKAILSGKGNKDKAVSGLGMLSSQGWNSNQSEYTPLGTLLGDEIYYSENLEGMQGFTGLGALGEPITLASVGAAMGVLAGIVAALKQIGSIFKKGTPGEADFSDEATEAPENNVNTAVATAAAVAATIKAGVAPVTESSVFSSETNSSSPNYSTTPYSNTPSNPAVPATTAVNTGNRTVDEEQSDFPNQGSGADSPTASNTPSSPNTNNEGTNTPPDQKQGFWDKNKKWLKPVAIGAGGLVLIAIGVTLVKGNKKSPAHASKQSALSGTPNKRNRKKSTSKKHRHKQALALL